jgi:hypothetical protein
VESIVLHGRALYSAGDIGQAKLDADETSTTYGALDVWSTDPIQSLALQRGRLLVAGEFSEILGRPRRGLGALDMASASVLPWTPGLPAPDTVERIVASDDRVFVALRYPSPADPKVRLGEIRDQEIGQPLVTVFNLDMSGQVFALALDPSEDTLFVAGQLGQVGVALDQNLVAVDVDRASPTFGERLLADLRLQGEQDGTGLAITALAATKDTLYLAGWFTAVNGVHRHHLAALDIRRGATFGELRAFAPGSDGAASALLADGGRVLIGGRLESTGGVRRHDLAALDLTSYKASCGSPTPFAPELSASPLYYHHGVEAIRVHGDRIFVGGDFGRAIGTHGVYTRCGAAAFHVDPNSPSFGLVDDSWNPHIQHEPGPDGIGCLGNVTSIAIDPESEAIYLAGPFTHVGNRERPGLVRVNSYDGFADDWSPGPTGTRPFARKLLITDRTLIVSGDEDWLAGSGRTVAFDLSTGSLDARVQAGAMDPFADPVLVDLGGHRILLGSSGWQGGLVAIELTPGSADFGSVVRSTTTYSVDGRYSANPTSIVATGGRLFASALRSSSGEVLASLDGDPDSSTFGYMTPLPTPAVDHLGTLAVVGGRVYGTADLDTANLEPPLGLAVPEFVQPVRLWPLR